MSLAQFEGELRRVARFGTDVPIPDPLAAALKLITEGPGRHGSRLLGRLLRALADRVGEFRRAEICAFDADALRVAVALMNAAHDDDTNRHAWRDAAAAADAANA